MESYQFGLFIKLIIFAVSATAVHGQETIGRSFESYIPFATYGRSMNLNDNTMGDNKFSDDDIQSHLDVVNTTYSDSGYKMIQSDADAKKMLGLSGKVSLQLSIGRGTIGASGAGIYVKDTGDRSQFAELLFVINVVKSYRFLKNIEDLITTEMCQEYLNEGATHIITGIKYGSQCIVSIRSELTGNESKATATGHLAAQFEFSKINVNANGTGNSSNNDTQDTESLMVGFYCDTQFKTVATSLAAALKLVNETTKVLSEISLETPITMELTPIKGIGTCPNANTYQDVQFLEDYYNSMSSMLDDTKSAYKQIWVCIDNFILPEEPRVNSLKMSIMETVTNLQNVSSNLKVLISDIDQLSSNLTYFDTYSDTYAHGNSPWNYLYWSSYVGYLCNQMRRNAELPVEQVTAAFDPNYRLRLCSENVCDWQNE